MNLVIVESPTKARTLSGILGKDFTIEATMGHVKDLPKNSLAVDIERNFTPNYVIIPKKKERIKKIKEKAFQASRVYLATDPDREGEAIASHIKDLLINSKSGINDSKFLRIVFHEVTKEAVQKAVENPRKVDLNLVNAQIARRVLDRLVGYKLSPILWKKVRRGLSAGRVQSVALRLIVEREREIENFHPEEYWEIFCDLRKKTGESFRASLLKINDKKQKLQNKKEAYLVVKDLQNCLYKVLEVKKREVKKFPYPPFTTSTMAQSAFRLFGWSAKKTMTLAQKLYEKGLITYHRTDSTHLSEASVQKVRKFISETYGKDYLPDKPRIYKTKSKLAQEAHEAIRPTNVYLLPDLIKDEEIGSLHKSLYSMIWKRFVSCQMKESVFEETVAKIEARPKLNGNTYVYILKASGIVMKFNGFRKVIPFSQKGVQELPDLQRGQDLDLIKVISEQKFTQPSPRYNEASLIKTLEKLGIGRPSTYAPIITTIQIRSYVEKVEGRFKPTPLGIAVNDFLIKNFPDIVDYSFTAYMEDELDEIAKGKLHWVKMMNSFYTPFKDKLEKVENTQRIKIETESLKEVCSKCGQGELVIRIGKFGKFVSCSRFPECSYKKSYVEKVGRVCPECEKGEIIVRKSKKGKRFYGCSRFPDCKWASWRLPKESKIQIDG